MKSLLLTLITILSFQISFAQIGEFELYKNGLIYSQSTMSKLSNIADSLNLKFRVCDISKKFYSKYQSLGHKVKLEGEDIIQAKKDIENNISIEEFINKYPKSKVIKDVLIVQFKYKDYQEKDIVEFSQISLNGGYGFDIQFEKNLDKYSVNNLTNWVFKHYQKSTYSKESITAFYLPNKLEKTLIPQKYSQMISYSDCMIDTTTSKFKKELEDGWIELPKNWKDLSKNKQESLLTKLRKTRVIGRCSQDSSPREHAINIAMLSAETQNWEVFLRAHLDVMNDRFDRMSDGGYALAQRKTYIKELEELNINVLDLILGISFRVDAPSNNHYYGSIGRLGRALSETKNKEVVETELFNLLKNNELDLYNRVIVYYLLENYIYNLNDYTEKDTKKALLNEYIKTLPKSLSDKMKTK